MATNLYSYTDKDGKTRYIGATSEAQAKQLAGVSKVSLQDTTKFSSDLGKDTSPERIAEIASQSFVTPEVKQSVQKAIPSQTVYQVPQAGMVGATTEQKKDIPKVTIPTSDRASSLQSFSSALQQAVNLGRAQRQSAELDFLGGVVPVGAVSAGQFTGLLRNLNQASNQFTEPLVKSAMEFAQEEQQAVRDEQNSIRDLALAAVEAGGSQETVNAILSAGTLDSAISVAAGTLNTSSKMVVEKVGSNLVQYDPADPENTTKVLFNGDRPSGGGSGGGSGTTPTGGATSRNTPTPLNFLSMSSNEALTELKKRFAPNVANKIASELTNEQLKLFLNDHQEVVLTGGYNGFDNDYYKDWKVAAGLDSSEEEEKATSTGVVNPYRSGS